LHEEHHQQQCEQWMLPDEHEQQQQHQQHQQEQQLLNFEQFEQVCLSSTTSVLHGGRSEQGEREGGRGRERESKQR
jgi:hypothetical protein